MPQFYSVSPHPGLSGGRNTVFWLQMLCYLDVRTLLFCSFCSVPAQQNSVFILLSLRCTAAPQCPALFGGLGVYVYTNASVLAGSTLACLAMSGTPCLLQVVSGIMAVCRQKASSELKILPLTQSPPANLRRSMPAPQHHCAALSFKHYLHWPRPDCLVHLAKYVCYVANEQHT